MEEPVSAVSARFDDRQSTRSIELLTPTQTLVASRIDEVIAVVAAAEAAAESGRWVAGFVAYEAAPAFDDALAVRTSTSTLPLAWFGVFDDATEDVELPERGPYEIAGWQPELSEPDYLIAIGRIHELIEIGETYQTNLTFRLRSEVGGSHPGLYRDLVDAQRGRHNALIDTGDHVVVSASPELFFRWDGRRIETKPMKGTLPRGRWEGEDRQARELLLTSDKDRAENVMIVDLLRNDLGRVARFGSVQVEQLFEIERFATVWQMTSSIAAETRPDVSLVDVFRAMFPCGSVTGAPKARTMQIISSLELSARGLYCGAIGLLAPPGSGRPRAEFSVAIRTVVVDSTTGAAEYGIGGGVVHESTALGEHAEAMVKARVLTERRPPMTLLETMRWDPDGGVWLLDRHLDRLRSSARYFGIGVPEPVIAGLLSDLAGPGPLRVRLLVPELGSPTVETSPLDEAPAIVGLAIDRSPIDRSDVLRFHKTTDRRPYEAAASRHPAADDVVLVNERQEIVETTRSNLAVRIEGEWLTPPLDAGCLPGAYRAELVDGGLLRVQPVFLDDLVDAAEEVAVINSVRGWKPAKVLHGA